MSKVKEVAMKIAVRLTAFSIVVVFLTSVAARSTVYYILDKVKK